MTGLLFMLSFTATSSRTTCARASRLLAELVWLLEDYEPVARA